jgi:hypothetical protein
MAVIAPWLTPADPLKAASEGARIGLEERGQDINAAEAGNALAQRASEAAQHFSLAQQELAAHQHNAEMENATKRSLMDRQYQLQNAREAAATAYRNQNLELAKTRLADVQQKYAKHLSDAHLYNVAIQGGMSPRDAARQFPDAFSAGQWGDMLRPEKPAPKAVPSLYDKKQLDSLYDIYNDAAKKAQAPGVAEPDRKMLTDKAASTMEQIKQLAKGFEQPAEGAAQPVAGGGMPQPENTGQIAKPDSQSPDSGLPKAGDVIGGYKFKGGDPSSQDSWEEVQPGQ